MTINLAALELQLVDQVANTTDTEELLIYSKILSKLKNQWVSVVETLGDLPAAADSEGEIYFVEEFNRLYFSNSTDWLHLDNTVIGTNNLIYGWGSNNRGEIGNNTCSAASYYRCLRPAEPCGGFTDWIDASAGNGFTVALRSNGTLWAWGCAYRGRLGNDDDSNDQSRPVSVVGGFTDWCQVSVGIVHTVAIRDNGTAWAWGRGNYGRLGNDTTYCRSSPVSVVGGFTDWCQVSSGYNHTAAVRNNGTAWSWGSGYDGRLGDDTTDARSSPVSVVGGFTDWCQLSAGFGHTAAVRTNGTLWTWGCGNSGRLGNNCDYSRSSPVSVVGGFTDWCQASASYAHTAAVRSNGTLWVWGDGYYGRLGINSTQDRSSPITVLGGFTDWVNVSAGAATTHAVRANGSLWGWGASEFLGTPTYNNKSSPICIIGHNDWVSVKGSYGTIWGLRAVVTG